MEMEEHTEGGKATVIIKLEVAKDKLKDLLKAANKAAGGGDGDGDDDGPTGPQPK